MHERNPGTKWYHLRRLELELLGMWGRDRCEKRVQWMFGKTSTALKQNNRNSRNILTQE